MMANTKFAVKPVVKAGDFIGFSGRDWISAIINMSTLGIPFYGLSHCGIVVASVEAPDNLLLFESTATPPSPCIFSRQITTGVQAHRFSWRVADYSGTVWHYPLAKPLSQGQVSDLWKSCVGDLGKSYDYLQAFRSRGLGFGWLEKMIYGEENLTSVFCSEFVAMRYRAIDVFRTRDVSKWSPNKLSRALLERGAVAGYYKL